jgi:hypothetical protein
MITPNGILLETESRVVAPNTGTWADLEGSSWSDWRNYTLDAPEYLTYLLEAQDLGSVQDFCLTISTQANGIVDYYVYTSNTGAFTGEETEHEILSGDSGISAFTARYFQVGIRVEKISAAQEIRSVEVRVIASKNKISLDNVNTADLGGTALARTLTLPKPVSAVTNIQITPKSVNEYQLDVYVTDYPDCQTVLPRVVSKTEPYQIALVGLDNTPKDAVVDIVVEFLPEMYMDGLTLRVR